MNQRRIYILIFSVIAFQALLTLFFVVTIIYPGEHALRKQYYQSQSATLVSPHGLREKILHGDRSYIIVDTRDKESYEAEHIVGAVHIEPVEGMVERFRELRQMYPDREIVIYCYTHVCMRGRKIGKVLAENGLYVQELGIGFNEWKNFWREWNYENEWSDITISDYVTDGPEPGEFANPVPKKLFNPSCGSVPGFEC